MGRLSRLFARSERQPIPELRPRPGSQRSGAESDDEPPRRKAIDDLSLTLRDGETLSIIGPSGCGKTTLLRIIAGLIKPDQGEVRYDGVLIGDIPVAERGIGMVFQSYALYPHMIAYDNIGFYDTIHNHPEKIPERIHHIVRVMGVQIEHLLSRKPPTLSGGEQQRVAMARCLARDPKLFLFDEPLSNLDAKLRTETRVQIRKLLNYYHITSVYVTHDQVEAAAMADRIAIMRAGKIEQIGTFRALYETPRNIFVAQFFGSPAMNIFPGTIWNNTWEGRGGLSMPISRPGLRHGQPVAIGIRPEHILLTDTGGFEARIDLIEPLHAQQRQLLHVQLGRSRCVVSTELDRHFSLGDTIHMTFPQDYLYLFDDKTGARIG